MKTLYPILIGVIFVFLIGTSSSYAATLSTASDTISTSRPSASSPLTTNAAASSSQLSIVNNGSRYLASDSAKIIRTSTGTLINTGLIVSSQSGALTSVFLGNTTASSSQANTDVLFTPITAMHTIQFTTVTQIPVSGIVELTFPILTAGDADNDASPSATTFQFNNVVSGGSGTDVIDVFDDSTDISGHVTVTETEPSSGTAGVITLTLDGSTSIAAGSVVKIYLGCTTSTSTSCTAPAPRIINPTKLNTAGTAAAWKINVQTQDASTNPIDEATVVVGTIESVYIQATVDPSLTFTIGGIANATAINTGNTTGCTNTETTNAGIASTATAVNLGILANTPAANTKISNIAAQLITVSTNASGGYALTATSSGGLKDFSSGYTINSSTTPAAFPATAEWFGIHSCGLDVDSSVWTESSDQNCSTQPSGSTANECYYGFPSQTTPMTLASDGSGPIDNTIITGNGLVSVEYAAGVDGSVPAGTYQTYITYVATPTF